MNSPSPLPGKDERRTQERRILRVQAELLVPGRPAMPVRTVDISEGGVSVLCTVNLSTRTECTVRLPLPVPPTGRKQLELRAVVLYSILSSSGGGFQLGMNVLSMDEATRNAIKQFVKN
ncbi:MAG: PilZ domain-containing protein [Acidovorax sp.]|uniref:PilZ domain-containing protein n=1 Tax=Acidovorax sp. TaxID=1872122 RepID=UPI00260B9710|nr:PilZ domain-containing protein [Acidovorax sp.]MDH4416486.1 PilZ domain-containing protein [Acidovorax sp.]